MLYIYIPIFYLYRCWLKDETEFVWAFIAPVIIIILVSSYAINIIIV